MQWEVIGKSVQGSLHQRTKTKCQDKIQWEVLGNGVVLAVADGHGSARSPKSDIGAGLAVRVARRVLKEFYQKTAENVNLSLCKRLAEYDIPKCIVNEWRKDVKLENAKEARKRVRDKNLTSSGNKGSARQDFLVQYGSTLLAVLATNSFIYFFQLGDGDILVVEADGSVSQPIAKDERLMLNETTSLCLPDAWQDAYTAFRVIETSAPSLILVSTDGYSNSFKTEDEFFRIGKDYLTLLSNEGMDYVNSNLGKWLSETSLQGSGDDITLGIIWNTLHQTGLSDKEIRR